MRLKQQSKVTETMLVITVGFLVIFLISGMKWAAQVAVVVGVIGIFSAFLSNLITLGWTKLAMVLSMIVPNILLAVVFFLFLLPLALLSRLFAKKDVLFLKQPVGSTYIEVNKTFEKKMFDNPW
jgi:hypothetical protein